MHTILGAIKETSTGYSAANEKFLQCQKEHSESVISCITSMKGELCDKVREIEQAHASQLQKQDDMIQQNAENIRKVLIFLCNNFTLTKQSSRTLMACCRKCLRLSNRSTKNLPQCREACCLILKNMVLVN